MAKNIIVQPIFNKIQTNPSTIKVNVYSFTGPSSSSGGGATTFTQLTDTVNSYTGEALKLVRVRAAETGLEFFTAPYLITNQAISLSGDITGSGTTAISASITSHAVTYAKLQQVAAHAIIGNPTASLANAQAIGLGAGIAFSGSTLVNTGVTTITSGSDIGVSATTGAVVVSNISNLATVTSRGNITGTGLILNENGALSDSYSLYLKRNNDSTPLGYYILAQNAAANSDIFSVNVVGNVIATSYALTGGTSSQILNGDGSTSTILSAVRGGTGLTSYVIGQILYANSTTTLAPLNIGANTQVLTLAGGLPTWQNAAAGFANPMTTFGDLIYENASPLPDRIPGNITPNKRFLVQTGTGTISGIPLWDSITSADISGIVVGGDLSGTLVNPTVSSINNNLIPVNAVGALTNDGIGNLSWTSTPSTLAGLSDINISSIADGNLLQYRTSDSKWHNFVLSADATISNTGAISLTNSAVTGQLLTGYTSSSGVLSGSDSILGAIEKLNGNMTLLTFLGLTDVPHSYTGQALKLVRVNAAATALEFVVSGGGGGSTTLSGLTDVTIVSVADGQLFQYRTSDSTWHNFTLSGDATVSNTGVLSIGSGKVTNTMLAGSIAASKLIGTDITTIGTISTGTWNATKIDLAYGGTNADLSATGGSSHYLKQSSIGANITVGTITASDIASGAALTKTDDTNVTLALGGAPNTALLAATSLTLGWTGTLADGRITSASNWNTAYNRSGISLGFTSSTFTFTKQDTTTLTASVPTFNQNTTGSAATLTTTRNIALTGDATWNVNFNGSADVTSAITLATINSTIGTFGSATKSVTITVNGKGLITAISEQTVTPAIGSITGLGTGVATALAINVGSAGAFVTFNGALGTPSSAILTNATGLPISTGISGFGTNWLTALGANLGSGWTTALNATYASGLTNPMTTTGDIIVGGASGAPTRLAIGTTNQILAVSGGTPVWTTSTTSNNKQAWVGYIFQEAAWTSLGNYTTNTPASTISISGGVLTLTGGANNFANYIKRNYTTAATCYTIDANIKPTADGNGIGLGILVSGTNTLTMEMDCNTAGARGTVYITLNGTRVATSSTVMSYTNSTDILNFSLTRANNFWTAVVYNTITGTTVSISFGQDFSVSNGVALKMGQPFIYIKGGTFTVTGTNSFNYFIRQKKGSILFCGDSITEGAYASTQNQSYVDIIRTKSLDPVELMAAGGTTSSDWANTLYTEILNFVPSVIYIMIGTNDALASTSNSTYASNLSTFESNLPGYKIVYLYVPPHGNDATAEGFVNTYNTSTLSGKTYKIDIFTVLYNSTTGFCASSYIATDFIHLNAAGNAIVATTIIQNSVATTDIPFAPTDRQASYITRGGSIFNFDNAISLTSANKLYLSGTQLLFNTSTVNSVIHTNFSGSFTMAAGTNYAMMVWPTMSAIANAQVVYGVSARDNRSLGAFTDGGWYGIVAQSSGGTDIARIGLTSTGTQVLELNSSTLLNTTGTASASGSVANLTYASSGGKNFYIRNTTAAGAMAYVLGNDAAALGAYMQLNGSTASGNSGANALNFVNPTNSTGKMGWWKSGATPMMELDNTFGGSLSIGAQLHTYNLSITQTAQASGVPKVAAFIGAAHTATTASTENTELIFDFSATIGINAGAMGTNRMWRVLPRTYNYVGATTATKVVTFSLGGGPIANTNATHTTGIAFEIESNNMGAGTTTGYAAYFNAPTGAGTTYALGLSGNINLGDNNIIAGTTTGIKLGTSTSQKLGAFNATPIVQPSGNIVTALSNLGWVTGGTVPGNQLVGTATNDSASAGNVGEEISSVISTYTNYTTTATYQNVTSITLTAGDWDIKAFGSFSSNTATITAAANAIFVVSTTTASASGATEGKNISYIPQAALIGTSIESTASLNYRVSIAGSTTYYLNTQATFTLGNPQFVGSIAARRIR